MRGKLTRIALLPFLLSVCVAASAQSEPEAGVPTPVLTSKITIPVYTLNPAPAINATVEIVGNVGNQTLYYWISANYLVGNANLAGPFFTAQAPGTLSVSNYVTINPTLLAGVISYDVLKTSTPIAPSGACACAVATAISPGTIVSDQSNATSAYTVSPVNVGLMTMTLQNEVQSAGVSHLILRQNDQFVTDLSVTGSGGGAVPAGSLQLQVSNNLGTALTAPIPNVAPGSDLVSTGSTPAFQVKPAVDPRDPIPPLARGAVGNCTADDTAELQAAFTAAFNGGINSRPINLSGACYNVTSQITYGDPAKPSHGFSIVGTGMSASEILYTGPMSGGGALRIYNPNNGYIANLYLIDGSSTCGDGCLPQSDTGLWLDPQNTGSCTGNTVVNVKSQLFADAFRVGHTSLSDVNDCSGNTFINIGNAGAYQVMHVIGNNTDGEFIHGLNTELNQYVIRCESCRNVTVDGFEHSTIFDVGTAQWDRSIYFYGDGNVGVGGPITLRNGRIENGSLLFWLGNQGASNDSKPNNLTVENVAYSGFDAVQTVTTPIALTLTPSTLGGNLPARNYCFQIAALDGRLGQSTPTAESCYTTTGTTSQIAVSWTPFSANDAMYRVYIGYAGPGSEQFMAQVWQPTTSYTLHIIADSLEQSYIGTAGVPSVSTNGTASTIGWFGEEGTLKISGSTFLNPGVNFQFPQMNGNNFTSVELNGNTINNATPEAPFSVMQVFGNGPTPALALRYTSSGSNGISNGSGVPSGFFQNRIVDYGASVTETVLNILDTPQNFLTHVTMPGLTFGPTLPNLIAGGPTAWYKADSLSLSNGANVTTWADSSGNGYDLTTGWNATVTGNQSGAACTANEEMLQGTSGAYANMSGTVTGSNPMVLGVITGAPDDSHTWVGQSSGCIYTPTDAPVVVADPTFVANAVNGMPAVAFSSAGIANHSLSIDQPYTVFLVYKKADNINAGQVPLSDVVNDDAWGYVPPSEIGDIGVQTATPTIYVARDGDTNFHLFDVATASGTSSVRYESETLVGATGASGINGLTLGYAGTVGTGAFYYYFGGDLAEVIIYGALSLADTQAVEAYLDGKYTLNGTPPIIQWDWNAVVRNLNAQYWNGLTTNQVPQVGSPTANQASCIKNAGPPVVIGYCSTVVSSSGACTCN